MAQKKKEVASTTKKTATKAAPAATNKAAAAKSPATVKASAVKASKTSTAKAASAKTKAKTTTAKTATAKTTAAKKSTVAKAPAKAIKPTAKAAAKKPAAKPVRTKVAAAAKAAAPVKTAKPRAAARVPGTPMTPKEVAEKVAAGQRKAAPVAPPAAEEVKKPVSQRGGFKIGEHVVYPSHGVGQIVAIDEQEIAGLSLELFVIAFEKDKMTLRVPTGKCESVGMRKLASEPVVTKAMTTLKGKARVKRTMWSRRAQEYEAKINSGDLGSIAEVVRDLYRSETQPEQSYSERQLYEQALERMAREIAAVDKLDDRSAVQRIVDVLSKSAKGRRQAAEDAEAAESNGDDIKAA